MSYNAASLWFLRSPPDADDYQNAYVNGEVEYRYRLPGTDCRDCSRPVGTYNVLPFACPEDLRTEKPLTQGRISPEAYDVLRERIAGRLTPEQRDYLEPGAAFMPGLLDIPSEPSADFLWAELGGPLVSERVRAAMAAFWAEDVYFTEISYRKVGRRSAKARAPIPESGEPEDIIRAVRSRVSPAGLPSYSRLNVRHQSQWPADAENSPVCPGCRRPRHPIRTARPEMTASMWRGHSLFYLASTLHLVVTSWVRDALHAIEASNVSFELAVA